jgi:hypothetical protein
MSYNSISESDYKFVESSLSDLYGIKLTSGKWKDVIITYGKITIKEDKEAVIATLSFTYHVEDAASFQPDQLEADIEFKNYLGDVLSHIINSKDDLEEGDS